MRPKTLFLLKTLVSSLVLFVIWPYVSKGYGSILINLLQAVDPYHPNLHENWPYISSLFLIPLIALTLSTPRLGLYKTGIILGVGVGSSIILDLIKLLYGIGDDGNYLVWYSIYHTLKWLVPLLVWVAFCYPLLGRIFTGEKEPKAAVLLPLCPLCSTPHQDMSLHIRNTHGEKALRIKKVRRFFAEEQGQVEDARKKG